MSTEIIPPDEPKSKNLVPLRSQEPKVQIIKEASEPDIALAELWRIGQKRKSLVLQVGLGLFALAVAYTFIQTPKFRSESTIEFSEENSDSLDLQRDTQGNATSRDYSLVQKTQVKALLSDTLALRIIKELKLEERSEDGKNHRFSALLAKIPFIGANTRDEAGLPLEDAPRRRVEALKSFHRDLSVAAIPGTRMISLKYMSPDPKLSALVLNTLVKDYKEQYFQNRYDATVETSGWLSKQLQDLRAEVGTSQQRLVDYQKQAGILGTDESHNIVMTRLEEGAKELMGAQENRIVAETMVQLVRKGDPEAVVGLTSTFERSSSSDGQLSTTSPVALSHIQALRTRQSEIELEYAEAATHYGIEHPKLLELRGKLDQIDQTIQQELENLKSQAENNYKAALGKEQALRAAFEDEKGEANRLSDSAVQYTILKHDVESSRTLYDGLLQKFKEATVLAGMRGSNIAIVDPALVPDRPARPIVLLNLGLGMMIGLICGLGTAFVAESLDDTVGSVDEAEEICGVQALGTVPSWELPDKRAPRLALKPGIQEASICVLGRGQSQSAEAFRAIRGSIIQSIRPGISTPIMVTSASGGEGRSTVSLNCAAAFAQHGSRVLLVEADMRHPMLNSYLNLNLETGLSSMIQNQPASDLPFVMPSLPNLSIIPAGTLDSSSSPTDLLDSKVMKELMVKWRGEYDFIFVDTPPALSVTDAAILAQACDLVVLVARTKLTRRPALQRVSKLFARLRPRVLGVILNGQEANSLDFDAR
jgi:capsular exopolysaccharide synthesis family protein